MIKFFIFLSFIPQRLIGVWVFMTLFQQIGVYGFDTKDLLFTTGQVLGIQAIVYFTVSKEKFDNLLEPYNISHYTWLVVSGFILDLMFVAKSVLFY